MRWTSALSRLETRFWTLEMISLVRLGAEGTYGYSGFQSNGSGGYFSGSKKSSARFCWPVMPASWVWTRRPRAT